MVTNQLNCEVFGDSLKEVCAFHCALEEILCDCGSDRLGQIRNHFFLLQLHGLELEL